MPENRTHLTASFRGEGKKFDLEFLDMAIDSTLCLPSRLQTVQAGNKRGSFKACLLFCLSQKGPHLTASFLEEGKVPDSGRVPTGFWMVSGVSKQPSAAWFVRYLLIQAGKRRSLFNFFKSSSRKWSWKQKQVRTIGRVHFWRRKHTWTLKKRESIVEILFREDRKAEIPSPLDVRANF